MVNDSLYRSKVLSICINKKFRFRSPLMISGFMAVCVKPEAYFGGAL